MRRLSMLAVLVAVTLSLRSSHAEDQRRVILERLGVLGDSRHPGKTYDVYAISRRALDAQPILNLRKDTIPLSMEEAVRSCFRHLKRSCSEETGNIKDQFVVWRVELKHVPGTKHGVYQGRFYYFVEMQLFGESGRPFFRRRAVLLDGAVVPPVREYE